METIIQAIFANEADAIAAQRALEKLDSDSYVSLGEVYVIGNDGHGNASVKSSEGETTGVGTVGGALLGSLLGLLGGPVGVWLGATTGLLAGVTGDLAHSSDVDDYLNAFAKKLQGKQVMLVAHLWEDSSVPVDSALKLYGGQVSRLDVDAEFDKANQAEIDEIDRKIAQTEADMAAADAADKAEFEAKLAEWKAKRDEIKARTKAKIAQRKKSYQKWLDNQRRKYEEWRSDFDEKKRTKERERLQNRIDRQEAKLAELREKEEAI